MWWKDSTVLIQEWFLENHTQEQMRVTMGQTYEYPRSFIQKKKLWQWTKDHFQRRSQNLSQSAFFSQNLVELGPENARKGGHTCKINGCQDYIKVKAGECTFLTSRSSFIFAQWSKISFFIWKERSNLLLRPAFHDLFYHLWDANNGLKNELSFSFLSHF